MRHVLYMTANTQFKETQMENEIQTMEPRSFDNIPQDNIESSQQKHMAWFAEYCREFPPARIATPHDADPDATPVYVDPMFSKGCAPYVAPIKRGPGRPRKDSPLPLFIKE